MQTHFTNSADGTRLRLGQWGDAERDVLIVPGLAEHLGRYEHVAAALVDAGWRVTAVELRGHGQSEGARGHVDAWSEYSADLTAALAFVGRPVVLVGHSMGGLVALDAMRSTPVDAIRALALSDPNIAVAIEAPGWKIAAAKLLSKLLPRLGMDNELDVSLISRDPDVVRRYEADPLVFSKITPRWYTEMVSAQERVVFHAAQYSAPLLMLLGDGDKICDAEASAAFAETWGGPHQIQRYPGLYHEIFNEPEKDQVLGDLITWMDGLQ